MRSRVPYSAAALALALAALFLLPSGTEAATAPRGAVSPLWAIGVAQQSAAPAQASAAVAAPLAGLSLEETRERVSGTEVAFRVMAQQKQNDDRYLAGARSAVNELRTETDLIAESTVENAITNYRQTDIDQNLLDLDSLNEGLRANALGDAAIIADTETFDEYRDKSKDLELAEINLVAEVEENDRLSQEVARLQEQLQQEQSVLADFEEWQIHEIAKAESITESGWAQVLGNKQGFYLRTCPVDGAHNFIDSWGFFRSGGRSHKGVDILAKTGTPVVSPVNGRVEFRSNRVGGRSFHLFGENGNYFYGTHLSGYGDISGEIRAGQVIGYVGDDGNAAGIPHLHFEIHVGGRGNQINPFSDTAAVCDGAQY